MDLTSLISTIVTANAALVAIIGGLLVSRVISLANDKHFFKRQISEIEVNIQHKESIKQELENYLFEDDLDDFVTKKNLVLMLKQNTLEEIVKKAEYDYLTVEQLEPYFNILMDIKEEVMNIYSDESNEGEREDELNLASVLEPFNYLEKYEIFQKDLFSNDNKHTLKQLKEKIQNMDKKHPNRSEWYYKMLDAIIEFYIPSKSILDWTGVVHNPNLHVNYNQKQRDKEMIETELKYLEIQKKAIEKSVTEYIQTKGIWLGIAVLILVSIIGILYPSILLPYPENYYNDEKTKLMLICLFGLCLTLIFSYLGIYLSVITRHENLKNSIVEK